MQTYSFNEGQITLIENLRTTNFKDLEEISMMLYTWEAKLVKDQKKIDKKYEGLKE